MKTAVFLRGKRSIFTFFALSLLVLVFFSGCDYGAWRTYGKAQKALENQDYQEAQQLLDSIPDYSDKKNIRAEVAYNYAGYLENVKKFDQAIPLFERYPDYKDSKKRAHQAYLDWGERLTKMGDHAKALEIYKKIGEETRVLDSILNNADSLINEGKFDDALSLLAGIENNPKADDLRLAAEQGALYSQGVAKLDINDFSTARKIFEKAVKIKSEKRLLLEHDYLKSYCSALKPVVTRLGSENKYSDVLNAAFPVWHKIRDIPVPDCQDTIKVMDIAADRYFFQETSRADWQQKINQYRETFSDVTARCNVYGGLINEHLRRTQRMINALKAVEVIGGECADSDSINWDESINKTLDLFLKKMVLDWKNEKDFKKIMILQQYVTTNLKDVGLDMNNWGIIQESQLRPEYKLNSTGIGGDKYMVAGWVKNPSAYRPLNITGIDIDCQMQDGAIKAKCAFAKIDETVLPGMQKTLNARVAMAADAAAFVNYTLAAKFEELNISNVSPEDIFQGKNPTAKIVMP